jgi:uncharacterized protein YcbX
MRVVELWRYPVKSLAGERLDRVEVLDDGSRGDRVLRIEDERGLVTARRRQRPLGLRARLGGDGAPRIEGAAWDGPEAAVAVHGVADPSTRVVRASNGGRSFDAAPILRGREPCERCAVTTIDPDTREVDPDVLRRVRAELDGAIGVYHEIERPGAVAVGDPVIVVD